MREYEFIDRILNSHFQLQDDESGVLVEAKQCPHHKPQRIKILKTRPISSLSVYRFDPDDEDFLPFFGRITGLKRFCDYVMLAEASERLIVILIEMKRSKNDNKYKSQLDAAKLFMEYVIASAERVKNENGYSDFDGSSIQLRRVKILADPTFNKLTTKPREKVLRDGREGYIILQLGVHFNPLWVI